MTKMAFIFICFVFASASTVPLSAQTMTPSSSSYSSESDPIKITPIELIIAILDYLDQLEPQYICKNAKVVTQQKGHCTECSDLRDCEACCEKLWPAGSAARHFCIVACTLEF